MSNKEKKINCSCYMMMPPKKLRAHPSNEKYFGHNNSRYHELSESIRTNGYLPQYPLTCVKEGNTFVILCGHRRWRVGCELDLREIPVLVRSDIAADSADAEKVMIEDNLHRPQQWREFSELERYMLSLQLDVLCEGRRGGDRRSEKFLESKKEQSHKKKRDEQMAGVAGMSPRYFSMLSVVTKNILKELAAVSPHMFESRNIYDQIKIALDNNLSSELTALSRSEIPVYRAYKNFKKANQAQSPLTDGNIPSVPKEGDKSEVFYKDVIKSLLRYFESQFNGEEFSEAAGMLLETPEGHVKQLKLLHKALNNVMQKIKTRCKKKGIEEPELFSAEEM
ncbi:MAG: ParB/RepB/Spo0J family partition protein [Dissulfurispiraceae bacterium]